jgi:hypothetical protein
MCGQPWCSGKDTPRAVTLQARLFMLVMKGQSPGIGWNDAVICYECLASVNCPATAMLVVSAVESSVAYSVGQPFTRDDPQPFAEQ